MNLDWQDPHMRRAWILSIAFTTLCSAGYVTGRLTGLEGLKAYSVLLMAPGFILAIIPAMLLGGNVHDPNEIVLILLTPLLNVLLCVMIIYVILTAIDTFRPKKTPSP